MCIYQGAYVHMYARYEVSMTKPVARKTVYRQHNDNFNTNDNNDTMMIHDRECMITRALWHQCQLMQLTYIFSLKSDSFVIWLMQIMQIKITEMSCTISCSYTTCLNIAGLNLYELKTKSTNCYWYVKLRCLI